VVREARDGGAGGAWVRSGLAVVERSQIYPIWPGMSAGPAMSVSFVTPRNLIERRGTHITSLATMRSRGNEETG